MLTSITPVLLAWNEECNLPRTLSMLDWARDIVVVDSGSTDATRQICAGFPNVRVIQRAFDSHSNQWNFAISETGITTEWVLALDADYVLTPALVQELASLQPSTVQTGFLVRFRYCIDGFPLRGTLYPPVVALYRRAAACYRQDGHTQRLVIAGELGELRQPALHDDRKPLARWLQSQVRYAELECALLQSRGWRDIGWADRLRKMVVVAPWLVPLYCFTVGQGFRDGRYGLYYAVQRGIAEAILALMLIRSRLPAIAESSR